MQVSSFTLKLNLCCGHGIKSIFNITCQCHIAFNFLTLTITNTSPLINKYFSLPLSLGSGMSTEPGCWWHSYTVQCYTCDSDDRHNFPPMSPEEVSRWKFYTASDGHWSPTRPLCHSSIVINSTNHHRGGSTQCGDLIQDDDTSSQLQTILLLNYFLEPGAATRH